MKALYALYDRKDCFIDCDLSLKKITKKKAFLSQYEKKQNQIKICKIQLEPQDDVFQEEDKIFIEEELKEYLRKGVKKTKWNRSL